MLVDCVCVCVQLLMLLLLLPGGEHKAFCYSLGMTSPLKPRLEAPICSVYVSLVAFAALQSAFSLCYIVGPLMYVGREYATVMYRRHCVLRAASQCDITVMVASCTQAESLRQCALTPLQ